MSSPPELSEVSSYKDTSPIDWGPTLMTFLNLYHLLKKVLSPNMVTLSIRTFTGEFWDYTIPSITGVFWLISHFKEPMLLWVHSKADTKIRLDVPEFFWEMPAREKRGRPRGAWKSLQNARLV